MMVPTITVENSFVGVHIPGPAIKLHTNVAYVTDKPVRYVVIILWLE